MSLENTALPKFDEIKISEIVPRLDDLLKQCVKKIDVIAEAKDKRNWQNFVMPLFEIENQVDREFAPVSHLNGVKDSKALRQAYEICIQKLTEYSTNFSQDKRLFLGYQGIRESDQYNQLSLAQKKVIDNAVRDFKLAGVDLDSDNKKRYMQIQQTLSKKMNKFSKNVLDASQDWTLHLNDESALTEVPESVLSMAKEQAEKKGLKGFVFTLHAPMYIPFMMYVDSQDYRKQMYRAFATRASDCEPSKADWDNSELMVEILKLRSEKAKLLGFKHYGHLSMATKMAKNVDGVIDFLIDLKNKAKPIAENEYADLKRFASEQYKVDNLEAWDIAYYSEKFRQQKFNFTQEDLKAYFPLEKVLKGLFELVNQLFNINVVHAENNHLWHDDVRFFEIKDNDQTLGHFYLDLFAREHKRSGAWMAECVSRMRGDGGLQKPAAFLTCNFTPPLKDKATLLTHEEVLTLFHEFGHGLHHLLTQIDEYSVSGISGVAWDAVELPSQFLENWCWNREGLDLISSHYENKNKLPDELLNNMVSAKNFLSAMMMLRQIEFSLFDIVIHRTNDIDSVDEITKILNEIRDEVSVINVPEFNRFQHSFSHIFAGGYAAGYYSYKWAEVLSADAFSLFEEKGLLSEEAGNKFKHCILEKGGSKDPMQLFVEFRGREPTVDALLRHSGLVES